MTDHQAEAQAALDAVREHDLEMCWCRRCNQLLLLRNAAYFRRWERRSLDAHLKALEGK